MNEGRTQNLTKNVIVSVISQIIVLVVSFANRTVFIRLLGAEYLGVDGLFTSILTVFMLAELGIGSAIIFNLYSPVANGNHSKARQYIALYSKAYNIIISVIAVAGIALIPFLNRITKVDLLSIDINIYIVYVLFLLNTISSYFLAHKQAVLTVNQKQRVVSVVQTAIKVICLIIECVVLYYTKNYYLFLSVKVFGNYLSSIIISIEAKKRYPLLCIKANEKLSKEEVDVVKKNVWALFIRRIGYVVLSSTDNIIINVYISTVMVGIYSNHVIIVNAVRQMTSLAVQAMTASIGNFVATNTKEKIEKFFNTYTFTIYLIYGTCTVLLFTLTNRFILLLWGEEYLLSKVTLFFIVLDFLMYGFQMSVNTFRDTTGNFVQGKYRSIISALVNIVLSVILAKKYGIAGIILATVLSRVFVAAWYDPYVLYKYFFGAGLGKYYSKFVLYIANVIAVCIVSDWVCSFFSITIPGFFISAVVSAVLSAALLIPYIKTREFTYLYDKFINNKLGLGGRIND